MSINILCIELSPIIPNLGKYLGMPRYGLLTISSIISRKTNYAVKMLFEPYVGSIDVDKILSFNPDIILLNGLTTSVTQNKHFIKTLRGKSNKPFSVISGGEHVTMFHDSAKEYSRYNQKLCLGR